MSLSGFARLFHPPRFLEEGHADANPDAPVTCVTSRCDLHHTEHVPTRLAYSLVPSTTRIEIGVFATLSNAKGKSPERVVGKAIGNRATKPPMRVQLPTLRPHLAEREG